MPRRRPQRGTAHSTVSQRQRDHQAKLGQLEMDRFMRRLQPRCACLHGPRVHPDGPCLVDTCGCKEFGP